jgi:nucleoside-diphosphate kinase
LIERTLVLLQRDAVEKGLEEKISSRFVEAGLKILKQKKVVPTQEMSEKHYRATDEQLVGMGNKTLGAMGPEGAEKMFGTADAKKIGEVLLSWSRDFIVGHTLVAMVLEGEDAIKRVRAMIGFTDPSRAEKGTIRGDFGDDSIQAANKESRRVRNLVHASDSPESAKIEIDLWFPEGV